MVSEINERAKRLEEERDLRAQFLDAAGVSDSGEDEPFVMTIRSLSGPRVKLYRLRDGSSTLPLPQHIAANLLRRRDENGFLFTADPSRAPAPVAGKEYCFLHPNSPEAEMVDELQIQRPVKGCRSDLPNEYARDQHGKRKHKVEWQTLQDFIERKEKEEDRRQRQAEIDAMMQLARTSVGQQTVPPVPEPVPPLPPQEDTAGVTCSVCGEVKPSTQSLGGHMAQHRKKGELG